MSDWIWVSADVALAVHERQLAEHGGVSGVRDAGLFDSAMARPQSLAAYETPDAARLAAAYAFGIARNHPFADGNKRTAWVTARLFLMTNGIEIGFERADAIRTVQALAAGTLSEEALADWFRARVVTA